MISTVITESAAATTTDATPAPAPLAKRLRNSTAKVKDAKKKKKAKAKETSMLALDITSAALACGCVTKQFGSETRPSYVVKLPAWSEFKTTLEANAEGTALAQTFLALRTAVEVLCGDASSTWVIHTSGSFAMYGKLNG